MVNRNRFDAILLRASLQIGKSYTDFQLDEMFRLLSKLPNMSDEKVQLAVDQHQVNPTRGGFLPTCADIVRELGTIDTKPISGAHLLLENKRDEKFTFDQLPPKMQAEIKRFTGRHIVGKKTHDDYTPENITPEKAQEIAKAREFLAQNVPAPAAQKAQV